jgi:hypothetical protein
MDLVVVQEQALAGPLDQLHRTADSLHFFHRRCLEPIAGSFRMLSKLLQQHLVVPEVVSFPCDV